MALWLATACMAADSLKDTEICNGWYKDWDDKIIAEMQDMPFVVASHPDNEILLKVHKQNAHVLAYLTFYQAPPNSYYQHANIADHLDWICIHPDGKQGESVFKYSDKDRWVTTCPNSIGYREYVLKTVRLTMAMGVDGLFIDNGHPDVLCDGPKYGKHKHIYSGKDNTYAYRKLLEDIRAEVKTYGDDKIVIVNPGGPQKDWLGACDGQMLESYICSWAWDNRWAESKILKYQQDAAAFLDKGCAVVALSYIGHTKNPPREDAYYCYAWARLSGFIWADWFTAKDTASDLYKVRLGKGLGPMATHDGYYSRDFQWGMVAATSEAEGASFHISAKDHPSVLDVFNAEHLKPGPSGDYEITLDKGQGRVYMY